MHNRMARLASAQIKHQDEISVFFRNEAGYRICCITKIASEDLSEQAKAMLKDMEILSTQQESLNHASLIDDLMGTLIKQASKYPEYNAKVQCKKYESVLVDHTSRIRTALENADRPNSDTSVAEHLETLHALQPSLNDSAHSAMLSFALTKTCFEMLNQELMQAFFEISRPVLHENPDLLLQAL